MAIFGKKSWLKIPSPDKGKGKAGGRAASPKHFVAMEGFRQTKEKVKHYKRKRLI